MSTLSLDGQALVKEVLYPSTRGRFFAQLEDARKRTVSKHNFAVFGYPTKAVCAQALGWTTHRLNKAWSEVTKALKIYNML